MEVIRIRKWSEYQHYKDGRKSPSWIKLHAKILSSRTWTMSDDTDRALAIALMLLAAQTNNEIPNDPAYIRRVAYLNKKPSFDNLVALGFIRIENEGGETVKVVAAKKSKPASKLKTADRFAEFWNIYPNKKAKVKSLEIWKSKNLDKIADDIIADVKKRCLKELQWTRDDGQFIPMPTTYLNGERWSDSMTTTVKSVASVSQIQPGRDF